MKVTTQRIKEMREMLLELETDLGDDLIELEQTTNLKEEHRRIYNNAIFNIIVTWNRLEDLLPPWEE